MARVKIPVIVLDLEGDVVPNASVTIEKRPAGPLATIYESETGSTTITNPQTTNSLGKVSGWVDQGSYQATITGSGIADYSEPFEAVVGAEYVNQVALQTEITNRALADFDHNDRLDGLDTDVAALEADMALKGRLINVQRMVGANNGYQAIGTSVFSIDSGGATALRIFYTPPVDVWWEVRANIGTIQKVDAAYHYLYASVNLNTPDVDGHQASAQIGTQHSTVDTFLSRNPGRVFKLAAGVAYWVTAQSVVSGGSWQFYQGAEYLSLETKAFTR